MTCLAEWGKTKHGVYNKRYMRSYAGEITPTENNLIEYNKRHGTHYSEDDFDELYITGVLDE